MYTEEQKQARREAHRRYIKTPKGLESRRKTRRKSLHNNRTQLVEALGSKCVCVYADCFHEGECGITDARILQIDHIYGGGSKEIDTMFANSDVMYTYYRRNPDEAKQKLQILCANCNWMKRHTNNEKPFPYRSAGIFQKFPRFSPIANLVRE